jgi:hypothetical protein
MSWSVAIAGDGGFGPVRCIEDVIRWVEMNPEADTVSLEIWKGGASVTVRAGTDAVVEGEDCASTAMMLVEELMGSPCPHQEGCSIRDVYTRGDCEILAIALQEALGGSGTPHAVSNPEDDRGRRVRMPYLVHAGLMVDTDQGDMILDVDGLTDPETWGSEWMRNGDCWDIGTWGPVTKRRLESMQKSRMSTEDLELAAPSATLLATLCLGRPAAEARMTA